MLIDSFVSYSSPEPSAFRLRSPRLLRMRIQLFFSLLLLLLYYCISFASTALHAPCRIFHSGRAHRNVVCQLPEKYSARRLQSTLFQLDCSLLHYSADSTQKSTEGFSGNATSHQISLPIPALWYLRLMINQICTQILSLATSSPIS